MHQQLPRTPTVLCSRTLETNTKCLRKIHSSFLWEYSLIDITSVSNKHSQVVMESLSSLLDLGITLVYFSQPVTIHPLNKHCPQIHHSVLKPDQCFNIKLQANIPHKHKHKNSQHNTNKLNPTVKKQTFTYNGIFSPDTQS